MLKTLIVFIVSLLFGVTAFASKDKIISLTGVYQGKNIYVQNPYAENMKDFCTNEVYLNGVKILEKIRSSAFEIDMSELNENESVHIEIHHKEGCEPKVLNPQVIKIASAFLFTVFKINSETISWNTKGEKHNGKFFVEQFLNNAWVIIQEVQGKSSLTMNMYTVPELHHSGLNKYRIKYQEKDGHVFYSHIEELISNKPEVTFFPKRVSDYIKLSRSVPYEVIDAHGNPVRKGTGNKIDMIDLSEGLYYLNVDNKTEKILKK